jgi:transposase
MRLVAVKTIDQKAVLILHKVHKLLARQRTVLIHALCGHLAEFGIVRARGRGGLKAAIEALHETQDGFRSWPR